MTAPNPLTAINWAPSQKTPRSLSVVPEVWLVQLVPSELVRIVPPSPTVINCVPFHITSNRLVVPRLGTEGADQLTAPSLLLNKAPLSPTVTATEPLPDTALSALLIPDVRAVQLTASRLVKISPFIPTTINCAPSQVISKRLMPIVTRVPVHIAPSGLVRTELPSTPTNCDPFQITALVGASALPPFRFQLIPSVLLNVDGFPLPSKILSPTARNCAPFQATSFILLSVTLVVGCCCDHVTPLLLPIIRPPRPTAMNWLPSLVTPIKSGPESCSVQLVPPFVLVSIPPNLPTATSVAPCCATLVRVIVVGAVCCVQFVPSVLSSTIPETPTATNWLLVLSQVTALNPEGAVKPLTGGVKNSKVQLIPSTLARILPLSLTAANRPRVGLQATDMRLPAPEGGVCALQLTASVLDRMVPLSPTTTNKLPLVVPLRTISFRRAVVPETASPQVGWVKLMRIVPWSPTAIKPIPHCQTPFRC